MADEKDRLGNKLRDREKAAEDLYIAEQERKQLEKLRRDQGATGACPRDGAKLQPHVERGITIEICPSCHGIWLDKGQLQVAVESHNEAAVIHWVRSLFQAT